MEIKLTRTINSVDHCKESSIRINNLVVNKHGHLLGFLSCSQSIDVVLELNRELVFGPRKIIVVFLFNVLASLRESINHHLVIDHFEQSLSLGLIPNVLGLSNIMSGVHEVISFIGSCQKTIHELRGLGNGLFGGPDKLRITNFIADDQICFEELGSTTVFA
ncbi:hypothetical protein E6O75_ATG01770 [Venturia nashicola]|uniref:Uncharacterized protein n=1 Tax=Venturia nashicola TaxID=86259 RepID=A0A4Z1NIZ3_9PEZI|nr:hypothetical protein E6O75_ATG01770 [Venturia nashicola]